LSAPLDLPDAWRPKRAGRGIGGTDAGALLAYYTPGLDSLTKYSTAADVWLRLVHGVEKPRSAVMSRGLDKEPVLKSIYERETSLSTTSPGVVWHPNGWASCSPDALTSISVCEWKTTTVFARKSWGAPMTDEVPPPYVAQCVWNCSLCDRPEAHLVVAFGRDWKHDDGTPDFAFEETAIYVIERDRDLERAMLAAAERFQKEHIDVRIPPSVEPRQNVRAWKRILKGEAP